MGTETAQFYTSVRSNWRGRERKLQTRDAFRPPKIENHNTRLLKQTLTNLRKEGDHRHKMEINNRTQDKGKLVKLVAVESV